MKKIIIDTESCKGCQLCVQACPKGVLEMTDLYNENSYAYPIVIDAGKCTGCLFCVRVCPDICLEIRKEK